MLRVSTVGIDPGNTGAIACLEIWAWNWYPTPPSNLVFRASVYMLDVPVMRGKSGGEGIDFGKLTTKMTKDFFTDPLTRGVILIEKPSTRPGQGVASSGKFMFGSGFLYGFWMREYPGRTFLIRPQEWKKALGLSSDKEKSLEMARRLFPDLAKTTFGRKKDHGRAEAALIAWYGMTKYYSTYAKAYLDSLKKREGVEA